MKKLLTMLLLAISLTGVAQTRVDTLLSQLRDPASKKVFVVSHRGDWRNAPENSLQAVKNCIDMGVDMVEIDLKRTKDGHLVLMHDKTINRTMSGKGNPQDYTLSELKAMKLRSGAGHQTEHTIPTLEEVMLLAKGKILVNIDKGYDYFDQVYQILEKTGTVNQCVIKDGKPYNEVKVENGIALEKMIFMPVVKLTADDAKSKIEGYAYNYKPMMYELTFDDDDKNTYNLINQVKKTGSKIFINSLWPELCGGHHDDRAVERGDYEGAWGWIIKRGASFIQTDRPQLMLNYLRNRGLHE